jgi:hypothetical protein
MLVGILASFLGLEGKQIFVICVVAIIAFLATASRRGGKVCSRCREHNRIQALFCAQCGQRLGRK